MAFGQGVLSSATHLLPRLLLAAAASLQGLLGRARGCRFLTTLHFLATDILSEL